MQQLLATHSLRSSDLKNRLKSVVMNSTAMSLCQIEGHSKCFVCLLYLAFFPEFLGSHSDCSVQLCSQSAPAGCRSGSVEALSLETVTRDGIYQFFFSVYFSCISLVWNSSNKHAYRGHSTRLLDSAGPFSIYDTISVSGEIKNLYNFIIFSCRMAVCMINAVLNLNYVQYALPLWYDMSE
jgi:hypothetical protein